MQCLQQQPLSDTEMSQIQEILSQPVVKRYFLLLQKGVAFNLCTGQPSEAESDTLYMRKESILKGQLALLETLLSIQPVVSKES